jgi:hypothetical protein
MKSILTFLGFAALVFWLADCTTAKKAAGANAGSGPDPVAADRAVQLEKARQAIAGKTGQSGDAVYQNLKLLNKQTAGRVLEIMDIWGAALGVSCDHCHVSNEWASEVKKEKEITRQMVAFTTEVNRQLEQMAALGGEVTGVSCYTCHRGEARPARKQMN